MKIQQLLILGLAAGNLFAGTPTATLPDKSSFNLFNPVPEELLRDFDTDRPDKTNSPHTLDAGHYQLEMDLLAYTWNKSGGVLSESQSWANANFRIGLNHQTDLQLLIPFYQVNRDSTPGLPHFSRKSGTGDLTVALKTNFWGNDQGDHAGGLELYVKTPTASRDMGNGKVEGAALFLLDTNLPNDFDLGLNSGIGISAEDHGTHYHPDLINTLSLSRALVGPFSGYLEFASMVPTHQASHWQASVDLGFILKIGKNLQWDTGINLGVTPQTPDLQPFFGISARF